jgi:hypothetical protein
VDTGDLIDTGVIISTLGWIVIGVVAWMVVAAVVGVLIGRMIRQRDRQVPEDSGTPAAPDVPGSTAGQDDVLNTSRTASRGRQRRS